MIVENNFLANNKNLVPWNGVCDITDGNGIIIDDSRNTQNGSAIGAYAGKTLIQNNVIIGSGGPAVHVYLSDNVDILNNSTYFNQQTPQIFNGEIDAIDASNVTMVNNIMYAKADKPVNKSINSTNITISHNVLFGGNGTMVNGVNSVIGDPNYKNPLLNISGDFSIADSSPAIDAATSNWAPIIDYNGGTRPVGDAYDIGAFEYGVTLSAEIFETNRVEIYPNPIKDILQIRSKNKISSFKIFDLSGKVIFKSKENKTAVNFSNWESGQYIIEFKTKNGKTVNYKVQKE